MVVPLAAIETNDGSLFLAFNAKLKDISGLAKLAPLNAGEVISIHDNPKLPQCQVDALATRLGGACTDDDGTPCSGNDTHATCP